MTNKTNAGNQTDRTGFDMRGYRDSNISSSEIAGVVGGLLGAVVAHSEGSSTACVIATAAVGAAAGYALGNLIAPVSNLTTGTKIIGGLTALSFGLSCAGLTTVVGDAFGKLDRE